MSYTQLTEEHRIEIYAMLKAGLKQCQIAAQIGCHPSTICNELKRNTGQRGYRPKQAHRKAMQRRKDKAAERIQSSTPIQPLNNTILFHQLTYYESEGRAFESLRERHIKQALTGFCRCLFYFAVVMLLTQGAYS